MKSCIGLNLVVQFYHEFIPLISCRESEVHLPSGRPSVELACDRLAPVSCSPGALQATMIILLVYCVFRPTRPTILSGKEDQVSAGFWLKAYREVDWGDVCICILCTVFDCN